MLVQAMEDLILRQILWALWRLRYFHPRAGALTPEVRWELKPVNADVSFVVGLLIYPWSAFGLFLLALPRAMIFLIGSDARSRLILIQRPQFKTRWLPCLWGFLELTQWQIPSKKHNAVETDPEKYNNRKTKDEICALDKKLRLRACLAVAA